MKKPFFRTIRICAVFCLGVLILVLCLRIGYRKNDTLLHSTYTWDTIWTTQDGCTVFAGIPRSVTMADMEEYYGLSYPAYEAAVQNGSSGLQFELENAGVYCYLVFEDPYDVHSGIKRISLHIDSSSSGLSPEEFVRFAAKMEASLNKRFDGARGRWEGADITIVIPFYASIERGSVTIDIIYR